MNNAIIEVTVSKAVRDIEVNFTTGSGPAGLSAYQTAVANGYVGTEGEWLASLKGDKGDTGAQGPKGDTGDQGPQGIQGVSVDNVELAKDANNKVNIDLSGKVSVEAGKGLSTNDFTTEEKTKLAGIEEGASNYVLPSDVVQDSNYVHTDNNYTTEEKTTLSSHVANESNPHEVTQAQVGLGKVDNTADIDKPVSTAMSEALALKEALSNKVTALSGENTDTEYPSAKAVYDVIVANEQVIAAAIVALSERIGAIERQIKNGFGRLIVDDLQVNGGITKCGSGGNEIINGAGAPTVIPEYKGQFYVNDTSGKIYQAKGTESAADWGQTTN